MSEVTVKEYMETIVGSAIISADGVLYSVPRPGRHHHVISKMVEAGLPKPVTKNATQGFLLSNGKFIDRICGAKLAITNGQIKKLNHPPKLYSEDLW